MRNEMCPTNRTCFRDCFVLNDLRRIKKMQRSVPQTTTSANIDKVLRNSLKFKCPPGSFQDARLRTFER